jgi:hypothetical protein
MVQKNMAVDIRANAGQQRLVRPRTFTEQTFLSRSQISTRLAVEPTTG